MNLFTVVLIFVLSDSSMFFQTYPDVEFDSVRVCSAYAADAAEAVSAKMVGREIEDTGKTLEAVGGKCAQVVHTATEM